MTIPWPRIPEQSFGAQLRTMRITAGLSLRQAAKLAGLSPSFLTDVEYNRRMPSRSHVEKLAVAIGRPADDLFQYDPRVRIEELLDCLARRPEIASSLIKICRGVERGALTLETLDRLASDSENAALEDRS